MPSEGETDHDELDDYSKGIAQFVCIYTAKKLAERDARIAKLETQVEMLLALFGKSGKLPGLDAKAADVIDLPDWRKRTDAA